MKANNLTPASPLEDMVRLKSETRQQLRASQVRMKEILNGLGAPAPDSQNAESDTFESFVQLGVTLVQGIRAAMELVRKIKNLFFSH